MARLVDWMIAIDGPMEEWRNGYKCEGMIKYLKL